jgi:hypothetical protein
MKAKRGDLVVMERKASYVTTSDGWHEHTEYLVGVVANITRDGIVKGVRDQYGQRLLRDMHGIGQTFIVAQTEINVDAAAMAAWANPWPHKPEHTGKAFDSLDDVKACVSPFKRLAAAA